MIKTWACQYQCDRCHKVGPVLSWDDKTAVAPKPTLGWTHMERLIRNDGIPLHDLCETCSSLPIGELMKT